MNKNLYFVTTSNNKFNEISTWLAQLEPSVKLVQSALDLPEIQSLDLQEVALKKARDAWEKIKRPLIVDDAGLYLEKYPLFPGPLTKFVHQSIGMQGILHVAGENRKGVFRNCLVYMKSPDEYYMYEGMTQGEFIMLDHIDANKPLHCIDVLIPEGFDKTFAQLVAESQDEFQYHYRYRALKKCVEAGVLTKE